MSDDGGPYEKLEKPGRFESELPPNVLSNLDPADREMALAFERIERRQSWLVEGTVQNNNHVRDLNRRLTPIESFFNIFLANWKLMVVIVPPLFAGLCVIVKIIWSSIFK